MPETMTQLDLNYFHELVPDLPEGAQVCPFDDFVGGNHLSPEQIDKFRENYALNRRLVIPCKKMTTGKGKLAILVGASPAIKKNAHLLSGLSDDFIIITCPTSLKYLLSVGVHPDYVFALDGRDHWSADLDCDHNGAILVVTPFVSNAAMRSWKGDVLWYMLPGSPEYNEEFREDWANKVDYEISGGNVISTAMCWALKYLGVRDIAFTGMSLCFYEDYYHHGKAKIDEEFEAYRGKYMALDIYGNLANSTPALTMYKVWLESFAKAQAPFDTRFFNCTEDGILGVVPKPIINNGQVESLEPVFLPWMSIVPLQTLLTAYKAKFEEERKNASRV